MKKHNGYISFWKFVFCIGVALFHVGYFNETGGVTLFKAGYIFTEFFFITSGYYLAKRCYKTPYDAAVLGTETFGYIFGKITSFFPYILLAHAAGLMVHIRFNGIGIYQIVTSVWNLLFLQNAGFQVFWSANVPIWYISAMLLSMWVIYPLLRRYRDSYALIAAPLLGVFLLGYLAQKYPNLNLSSTFDVFVHAGVIRAFAELNLGVAAFRLAQYLGNLRLTAAGKGLLSLTALTGCLMPLFVTTFIANARRYDHVMVLMFFLVVAAANSGHCFNGKFFNNKLVYFLEKLSLPVYVNHYAIRLLFDYCFRQYLPDYYTCIAVYLVVILVVSLAELRLFEFARKHPVRNIFVSSEV